MASNKGIKQNETVEIPIELYTPEGFITPYADNTTIMHTQNEFILSFFQTEYPTINPAGKQTTIGRIKGRCVARVIISPNHMTKIIDLLKSNLETFSAKDADKDANSESKTL